MTYHFNPSGWQMLFDVYKLVLIERPLLMGVRLLADTGAWRQSQKICANFTHRFQGSNSSP